MIAITPDQSRELALLIRDLSPMQKADFYYFTIVENQDPYEFLASLKVLKHGTGDQKPHGNWANGSSESSLDAMPYEWKPKIKPAIDSTELSDWEYKKGLDALKTVSEFPVAINVQGGPYSDEFEKIIENKRFKSLEEIPQENGGSALSIYRQGRQDLEVGLWGVPETDKGPIYGFVNTPISLQPLLPLETAGYGGLKLILKESVSGRTTITAGDSVNNGLIPIKLTDAKTGNISREQVDGAFRSRAFQTGETSVSEPVSIVSEAKNIRYFEAQIHGGVSLDDISYIEKERWTTISPKAMSVLESKGITVKEPWKNR